MTTIHPKMKFLTRFNDMNKIVNDADYRAALEEIEYYFENEPLPGTPESDHYDQLAAMIMEYIEYYFENEPEPGTPEGDRFDQLTAMIRRYEDRIMG